MRILLLTLILAMASCIETISAQKVSAPIQDNFEPLTIAAYENDLYAVSDSLYIYHYDREERIFKKQGKIDYNPVTLFAFSQKGIMQLELIDATRFVMVTGSSSGVPGFSSTKTDDIFIGDIRTGEITSIELARDAPTYINLSGLLVTDLAYIDGELYLTTFGTGLIVYNEQREDMTKYLTYNSSLLDNHLLSIEQESGDDLILGSASAGVLEFDRRKKTTKSFNTDNSKLKENEVEEMQDIGNGEFVLSSHGNSRIVFNALKSEVRSVDVLEQPEFAMLCQGWQSHVFYDVELTDEEGEEGIFIKRYDAKRKTFDKVLLPVEGVDYVRKKTLIPIGKNKICVFLELGIVKEKYESVNLVRVVEF